MPALALEPSAPLTALLAQPAVVGQQERGAEEFERRHWCGGFKGKCRHSRKNFSGPPVWAIWMARMVLPCYNPRGTGEANGRLLAVRRQPCAGRRFLRQYCLHAIR